MIANWDGINLSDETSNAMCQFGFTLNGRQIVQESQFLRAAYSTFFARGNRSVSLSFSVSRIFGSVENAELFMLGHYASLSDGPASLVLTCEDTVVFVADAVLEGVSEPTYTGASVTVQYSFRAPKILTSYSVVATDLDAMSVTGTQSIPSGVDEHTFTGLGFASVPVRVIGSVEMPADGDIIIGNVVSGTLATTGFKIALSGVTPNGNYKFSYVAVL